MKKIIPFIFLVFLTPMGWVRSKELLRNFHAVDPNKLYRSAMLSPTAMKNHILQYGIKTVINLQGAHPEDDWYIQEKSLLDDMGIKLVDIPMRSERIPTRDEIIFLLDSLETAERPILIHCNSGSDRTGEASALYQMEYMKKTKSEALGMLSPLYFHFSWLVPSKKYFLNLYQNRPWAMSEYDPCTQKYDYFDQRRECHHNSTIWRNLIGPFRRWKRI